MYAIEIGPINNNPQTHYKVFFGKDASVDQILAHLQKKAQFREDLGLTTEDNTKKIMLEASTKLGNLSHATSV